MSVQKRCIRIICKAERLASTNVLFRRQKVLKFEDIVGVRTLLIVHRAFYHKLPLLLQASFERVNHRYACRRQNKFQMRYSRSTISSQSLISVGTKLWNNLPQQISSIKSFHKFKSCVKQYYIEQYSSTG